MKAHSAAAAQPQADCECVLSAVNRAYLLLIRPTAVLSKRPITPTLF